MRGTLALRTKTLPGVRIIPAHAGNSFPHCDDPMTATDHPRACGELFVDDAPAVVAVGSSPRMRGTPAVPPKCHGCRRIIPAHAGNSPSESTASCAAADHHRACGELLTEGQTPTGSDGSSPRMRGTHLPGERKQPLYRIIPAHAGNSNTEGTNLRGLPDHPRACGELFNTPFWKTSSAGSSPRMRGTLATPRRKPHGYSDHPRACGELLSGEGGSVSSGGSSPRMRGTRDFEIKKGQQTRIIPAHAGNSGGSGNTPVLTADHPRACGELLPVGA